ncbi:MAG: bifunctional diguanylate cyclase/phosphodiesterase [Gammaproteobacteria bacterium]|nr:MAG: bifunctional diguanylate cyclase/phosphodiesterase [Gammaproteobacteria bacterium]
MDVRKNLPDPRRTDNPKDVDQTLDVWKQLAQAVEQPGVDPVLRLLVSEAQSQHETLRGVTAAIATRYRALIDAVPDAITIHDVDGRLRDANEAACRLYRRERAELLLCSIHDLNPDLDPDFISLLNAAFDRGDTLRFESTLVHGNADAATLELHAHCYLDSGQRRVLVVTRDLGPRQQALELLRSSESSLRQVLRDVDVGVITRARDGSVISANPATCRILQISEAELISLGTERVDQWQFIDANGVSMQRSQQAWYRAFETGKPVDSVICGIRPPRARETLWIQTSATPRFGSSGEVDAVISIFSDVTRMYRDVSLFEHAQTSVNVGAWRIESRNDHVIWSAQMYVIFDLPPGSPVTLNRMLGHFPDSDRDRMRLALASVGRETPQELVARIETAIGRQRSLRIRMRALHRDDRSHTIVGSVQDMTGETAVVRTPVPE